jgi:succinoglycan biosynthesis protein ExoA
MPRISVIVAARDAETTIDACLTALAAQTLADHEVVVVDDGSSDRTGAIARAHGADVVRTEGVGASSARNAGIARARSPVVAFTDADCTPEPQWLAALTDALARTGAAGVGGPQQNVFPADRPGAEAFDAFFRLASAVSDYTRSGGTLRQVTHNASCNSAYQKSVLEDIGGFRPGLWPGEDVDLDLRLAARGARLFFVPDARVHHHRPGTLAWFRRMMRRYGAAAHEIVALHGRVRPIYYVPALTVVGAGAHLLYVLPAWRPWLAAADATIAGVAGAALVVTTPPRHWLAVARFGAVALWEWHRGWWSPVERRDAHAGPPPEQGRRT